MTEIASIDWFGMWRTTVFSENTAIFFIRKCYRQYMTETGTSDFMK